MIDSVNPLADAEHDLLMKQRDPIRECIEQAKLDFAKDRAKVERFTDLVAALVAADALIKYALPRFNWGASALDAKAIALLNEVPGIVSTALVNARALQDVGG